MPESYFLIYPIHHLFINQLINLSILLPIIRRTDDQRLADGCALESAPNKIHIS
jgi:hypothetical protein